MLEPAVGVNPVMPGWPGFVSAYPYGLLSRTVAPTQDPISMVQAKTHLRIDGPEEDSLIADLITATTSWAEQETERALLTQTWVMYLDSFPWWRAPIFLPLPPLQSVSSIKYYDQDGVLQTWAADQYTVVTAAGPTAQRGQIVPALGVSYPLLPSFALTQRRPDGVQVQFIAGWTSAALIAQAIKSAMKLMAGNLYRNREAGQIIRGSADVLPFGVDQLLAPYRVSVY